MNGDGDSLCSALVEGLCDGLHPVQGAVRIGLNFLDLPGQSVMLQELGQQILAVLGDIVLCLGPDVTVRAGEVRRDTCLCPLLGVIPATKLGSRTTGGDEGPDGFFLGLVFAVLLDRTLQRRRKTV